MQLTLFQKAKYMGKSDGEENPKELSPGKDEEFFPQRTQTVYIQEHSKHFTLTILE